MEPTEPTDPEDVKDHLAELALEDLQARTDALKGTMPDHVRPHVIAKRSEEILRGLVRRHLPHEEEGDE